MFFHEEIGSRTGLEKISVSLSDVSTEGDWVPVTGDFWLFGAHRIGEVREIYDHLEALGFHSICKFDSEGTFLALFVREGEASNRTCEFSDRD